MKLLDLLRKNRIAERLALRGEFHVVARDKHGNVKWEDRFPNLVTNAGYTYLLDVGLSDGSADGTHYLGLTDGSPTPAAGDTMSSHAGWAEVEAYDESVRQTWTEGGVSSQTITNSGSPAVFTIDTNSTTVGGAFLVSESTKGGTSGTLVSIGAFSAGDKSLDDDDTITVTYSLAKS